MGQRWSERYIHFILVFQQVQADGPPTSHGGGPGSFQVWSVCYFRWTGGAGIFFILVLQVSRVSMIILLFHPSS